MCCFSRKVESVSGTNIFARSTAKGHQVLVYSMTLSAPEDLAMILPLPVPKASKEDAVRFINLEKYPTFFADLARPFTPRGGGGGGRFKSEGHAPGLKVVSVGSFEASFVPSVKDFPRLDARFRLPADTWDKLPQYKDYGFAVFKLKTGKKTIHPMAFEFPRAEPKNLFFPTVHIHDGKVHAKAHFDHALYCQQGEGETLELMTWKESPQPAKMFMTIARAEGLLLPDGHVYQRKMRGNLKNQDTLV